MLLLYQPLKLFQGSEILPLHSIMLLLYPISSPSVKHSGKSFTFHYASTLSSLLSCLIRSLLTLHSIMLLLYREGEILLRIRYTLYIPLCFYFIEEPFYFFYLSPIFTFHYASTLSLGTAFCVLTSIFFTFHYASTLSIRQNFFSLPVSSLFHFISLTTVIK